MNGLQDFGSLLYETQRGDLTKPMLCGKLSYEIKRRKKKWYKKDKWFLKNEFGFMIWEIERVFWRNINTGNDSRQYLKGNKLGIYAI